MNASAPDLPAPLKVFQERRWLAEDLRVPMDAGAVPTMLTEEECRLLFWLARDYATGAGALVDLGCFAGGSTARMAAGVVAAGRQATVHAFDRFTIRDDQKQKYLYPAGIRPFVGNSMIGAVKELLRRWQAVIRLHAGEITEKTWDAGPIEILFIDAGKTPAAADYIAQTFMPHLIAGHSIVIQQDYQHWRQPWLAAQMERMSDCFEPVGWCQDGTVFFLCTRIPDVQVLKQAEIAGLNDDALEIWIRRAAERFPESVKRKLARCILGVQDNPGVRVPPRMDNSGFAPERLRQVLRTL